MLKPFVAVGLFPQRMNPCLGCDPARSWVGNVLTIRLRAEPMG